MGKGSSGEYDGNINGKKITQIELIFKNKGDVIVQSNLSWLGLSKRYPRYENRKFKLMENSPAFKIGFKPIDMSDIGVLNL